MSYNAQLPSHPMWVWLNLLGCQVWRPCVRVICWYIDHWSGVALEDTWMKETKSQSRMAAGSRQKDAYNSFFLLVRQPAFGFVSSFLAYRSSLHITSIWVLPGRVCTTLALTCSWGQAQCHMWHRAEEVVFGTAESMFGTGISKIMKLKRGLTSIQL